MCSFNSPLIASIASLLLVITMSWNCDRCAAITVGDEFDFPYQALVLHENATIHSGPGQVHYPTQELKQGQAVEVYRHDPGGWCAIRPVVESFSLVPESTLELVDEGIGKITEDGTRAWVGTALGAVEKPLWQVKLRKDELVEVLGQVSWPSPEGHSTTWYQIASPAGEFRWIRMSDIQLPASRPLAEMNQPATLTNNESIVAHSRGGIVDDSAALESVLPTASTFTIAPRVANSAIEGMQTAYQFQSVSESESAGSSASKINQGWRQATRPIHRNSTSSSSDSGFTSSSDFGDRSTNSGFGPSSYQSRGYGQLPTGQNRPYTGGPLRVANADLARPSLAGELNAARNFLNARRGAPPLKITDLELRLTNEMLKNNPPLWQLDDLEFAANAMLRDSVETTERQLAERFLSKIANCRAIQNGYRSDFATGQFTSISNQGTAANTGFDRDAELDAAYDAHGWLNKLVRNGGNSQPTFVLQDISGKITHHVSPIPGLNLERYLKSRIGIVGQRGYHSQLKLDHVTAHRIVELEKQR